MKATLTALIGLSVTTVTTTMIGTGTALADALLLSTTQQDYSITYNEPSGKPATQTLAKGTDTLGYLAVPASPGKPLAVTISDPDGSVLAKATVVDNRSYVLMPAGKALKVVAAGLVSQTASTNYQGVGIVSALPGTYSIDLFGDSGQGGSKALKPANAFDIKATTKLPASDTRYKATITLQDGSKVQGLSSVDAGSYVVVHKNYQGVVTLSSAGYIDLPAKGPVKK